MVGRFVLLLAAVGLQGCAAIVTGTTQTVSIVTPGCEGARCELHNDKGRWFIPVTPGSAVIGRSYGNLQVLCSRGATTATPVSIASSTKGMVFGNVLVGGVIGAGVDIGTGAAYEYPQLISVPMQCEHTGAEPAASLPSRIRLGLRVAKPPGDTAAGLAVLDVVAGSAAALAGLRPGDVLLSVNGSPLAEPEQLAEALGALREPWSIELMVVRDGVTSRIVLDSARRTAPP